jgi:hypothetical protein
MISPHPCHDFQVLRNCFSSPLAITVGKLPYSLELCFPCRQIGPWTSHTLPTVRHSFYHVQWSEHVIPYQVTCLLEQHDLSKKKASYTQGSDRASYCHPLFQLAHILENDCCGPNSWWCHWRREKLLCNVPMNVATIIICDHINRFKSIFKGHKILIPWPLKESWSITLHSIISGKNSDLISAFVRACYWTLSCARWIQSTPHVKALA